MNSKNMRKKIALGALTAMLAMGSGVASAGSGNWSETFIDFVLGNRCANAGPGNGGERIEEGMCLDFESEENEELGDIDPGKFGGKNRAPGVPRGR